MPRPAGSRDRRAVLEARRARRASSTARRAEVTDPAVVMEAAAQFLAVRSRSVAETRRRLLHLGFAAELTETVLDRLGRLGYLDDRVFARAWVESRDRSRPRGATALRQELRAKGVEEDVVRDTLGARAAEFPSGATERRHDGAVVAPDAEEAPSGSVDREAAHRLLSRKAASLGREPDHRRRRQKAYALLARHGFDAGICRDLSLLVLEHEDADDPDAAKEET